MMRKYILHFFSVLVLLLGAGSLSAQSALKGFDYQVVVRDANDYLVRNTNVKLKVVIKSVDDGIYTPHYIEHRASKTDANGYLALQVGIISPFATSDGVDYGSFDAIPWADHDSMMLDVVIDISNQGNFAATNPQAVYTLQRLATVPYAIFANEHQHLNAVLTKGNTAGNIQIKGVDYPTDCYDVVNKCYLDSAVMEYARKMNAQRNSEYKCVNQGASLVWRGRIISTDNLGLFYYFDTLAGQGSGGTDSILSLKVRINNGTHTSVNVDQCDHYQWNGTNYDASGTYTFSYRDAEDCPSVDTLHLVVRHSATLEVSPDHIDQALCRLSAIEPLTLSASYATITVTDLPAGVTYNSETHVISGNPATHGNSIYTIKATSTEGCENVERKGVIMVFPHDTVRIDTAVCAGTQFVYADFNKLTSPSASDVILPDTNRASTVFHSGCDSVVRVLRLTVHRVDTTRHDAEQICAGSTYSQYGFSHATVRSTQASVWHDTIHVKNQWQCDSTSTLTLAVRPVDSTVFNNEQVCAGTTYNSHGFNIATVRQVAAQPVIHDTVRTVNAAGCDSMAFLSLTVNPVDTFDIPEIDLCAGNTLVSPAYGFEVSLPLTTASSTYTDSHSDVNVHGCDSITNLTLQVHGVDSTKHDTVAVCGGATFVGDGFIITPERSLTDYYRHDTLRSEQNRYGCDSIVTIVVRVKHVDTTIITPEDARICANRVYNLNGFHIPTKPSLTNYIVRDTAWGFNSNGCDSVITLELSVMHNDSTIQQIEDIDTLHWIDGNVYFDTVAADDGVFAILPDTNMCDSVIQLIFNPTVTVSFTKIEGDLDQVLCVGQPISDVVVEASDATITATYLPDGVYYDTETKRLKGTPTAQGMWNYVLTAQSTTSSANSSIGGSFIIFEPLHSAFTETASGSYTWENNDWSQTYTASGTYTHDYEDINGCSATDTLHLTIMPLITVVYDTVCGAMLAEHYVDTLLYEDFDELELYEIPSSWYGWITKANSTGFVAASNLASTYFPPSGSGMAMWEVSQGLDTTSFLVTPKITIDDPANTHIKFYFRMPANGEKTDDFQVGYSSQSNLPDITPLFSISGYTVPDWISREGTLGTMSAGDYHFYIGHYDNGALFCAVDSFMVYVDRTVNHMIGEEHEVRYDTLTGRLGNDSIVEHRIFRKPSGSMSYDYVTCHPYTWLADGDRGHGDNLEHDATGTYISTYTAANGCEAADTLHFTLSAPTPFRYSIEVDYQYTWVNQGVTVGTYYKSGKYTHSYTNAAGCTQVDTLILTVLHSSMGENITIDNACDSFIWYNRDHEVGTYYANAVVYDTTDEGNGALVDTLNLTIVHPVYTTMDTFVCPRNFYKHDYDTILFENFESSDTLPDGWHQQYEGDNYWRIRDRVDVPITESLSWPYFAANGNHSAFLPHSTQDTDMYIYIYILEVPFTVPTPQGYDPDFPEDPQVEFSFQLLSSPAYERLNPRNCVSATIWSDGNDTDEPDLELTDLSRYIGDAYWHEQTNIQDPSDIMIANRIGLRLQPGSYSLRFEVSCLNGDIVGLDDIMLRVPCQHLTVPPGVADAVTFLDYDENESLATTYDTLVSFVGCDSIVERNWHLKRHSWNWVDTMISETNLPFTWNDSVFESFGSKTAVLTAANGCDSTVEMCLSTYTTHEYSICSGQEYVETGMDTLFFEDFRNPPAVMYGQSWQFTNNAMYRLDGWYPAITLHGYSGADAFLASNSPRDDRYWGGLSYAVTPDIEIFDPSRTTLSFRYLQPMQIYVDGIHSYNDLSVAWGKSIDMGNVKWNNSGLCRRCVDISETINPIWTSPDDSYNWRTKTISLDTVMGGWDYYRFAFIDQDWLMFSAIDSVMVYGPTVHRVPDYLWEYYEGTDTTIVDTAQSGINQGPNPLLQSTPDFMFCPSQYEINTYHITHAPRNKRFRIVNPNTEEMITAENAPDYLCYTANEYGGHQLFVHSPEDVSFTISDLPEGLEVSYSKYNELDNALVSITGTPTQPGQYTVTVEATDRAGMVCFPLTFSFLIDVKASPIYDTMEQTIDLDDVSLPYTWQGAVFYDFGTRDIKTTDRRGCKVYRHLKLNVLGYEHYNVCQGQEYIDFGYDTLFYDSFGELGTGGDWQLRDNAAYDIAGWRKVDNMRGYSHVLQHKDSVYDAERGRWLYSSVFDKHFLGSTSPRNDSYYGASSYAITNPITICDPWHTMLSFDYIQPRTLVPFEAYNDLTVGWAKASDVVPSAPNDQVFGAIDTLWRGENYSYEWKHKIINLDSSSMTEAGEYVFSFIDQDWMMFSAIDEVMVYGPRRKAIPEAVRTAAPGSVISYKDTIYFSQFDSCYKVTTTQYRVRDCLAPKITLLHPDIKVCTGAYIDGHAASAPTIVNPDGWNIEVSGLPEGLSYSEADGISGTPVESGVFSYRVVANSDGCSCQPYVVSGRITVSDFVLGYDTLVVPDSISWQGTTYYPGSYTLNYESGPSSISGCDSVTNLYLMVCKSSTIFDTIIQGVTTYTHIDTLLYETFDDVEEYGCPEGWSSYPGLEAIGFTASNSLDFGYGVVFETQNGTGNAMWEPSQGTAQYTYLNTPAITVTNPARTHFMFSYLMPAYESDKDHFYALLSEDDMPQLTGLGSLVVEQGTDVPEWVNVDRCVASISPAQYHIKFVHGDLNAWLAAVDDVKVLSIFTQSVSTNRSDTTLYFYDTIHRTGMLDSIVRYAVYVKATEATVGDALPVLDETPRQENQPSLREEQRADAQLPPSGLAPQAIPTEAIEDTARSLGHRDSDGVPVSAVETKDTYSRKENPSVSASLEW